MDADRIAAIRQQNDLHVFSRAYSKAPEIVAELCDALEAAQTTIERGLTDCEDYIASIEAERDHLAAIPTVYLHDLPPTWRDGDPEPPPELHVMGTPECVAGLRAVIAERARLASQVTDLTIMVTRLHGFLAFFISEKKPQRLEAWQDEARRVHWETTKSLAGLTPTEEPPDHEIDQPGNVGPKRTVHVTAKVREVRRGGVTPTEEPA